MINDDKNIYKPSAINANSFEEYQKFIALNIMVIKIQHGKDKVQWIKILESLNFRDKYKVARTPRVLKQYGIDEDIVISLQNFAYILWRHSEEYDYKVYTQMKEVIENYDLLLQGHQQGNKDYKFYKLFHIDNESTYGIEIAIDKPNDSILEYVVHVNYVGHKKKKAIKQYARLRADPNLIDEKKRTII